MKEKYYEFLNLIVERKITISNLQFYIAIIPEILFTLLVFIVSLFIKGQMLSLSIFVIYMTIFHIIAILLALLLFQTFTTSKFLQLVPTNSFLLLHLEFLFWGSIFFEKHYLFMFFLFIGLSIVFQIFNFFYQIFIVDKVRELEDKEYMRTISHLPAFIVTIISAAMAIITRLFMLSGVYMIISFVGVSIALVSFVLFGYAQVFTGWRKKDSTNSFIFTGRIK